MLVFRISDLLALSVLLSHGQIFASAKNNLYKSQSFESEYDYVIVGGGSSGAVLANRLSEDGETTVLLLEAGGAPPGLSEIPVAAPLLWGQKENVPYFTEPQDSCFYAHNEQKAYWPRYKALGGCSSHNFMIFVRGNCHDFDEWSRSGAQGWSCKEVMPYFLKSDDQQETRLVDNVYHASGGYQTISPLKYVTPSGKAVIKAAKTALGLDYGDYNGANQTVISTFQTYVRDGLRCSTEKAFLRPAVSRKNLNILTYAEVTKIHFEGKVASIVQFDHNDLSNVVRAKKEIILSAGAIGSPQLLLLSGIGPKEHLQEMGIPVIEDLPVGQNLQDHILSFGHSYVINDPSSFVFSRDVNLETFGMLMDGEGPLTMPVTGETVSFMNTKYLNVSYDWPDIEVASLISIFVPPQSIITKEIFSPTFAQYASENIKSFYPILLRPKSRGYLKLRSANPYEHPIIDPKYFQEKEDLLVLVEGMKMIKKLVSAPEFQEFKPERVPAVVPGCNDHVLDSDEYFECVVRTLTHTVFHPCGTCKMGAAEDKTTVVDPQLRVKGVKGLRVVDASVMPTVVSGHTNAACLMIAEKAADLIKGTTSTR